MGISRIAITVVAVLFSCLGLSVSLPVSDAAVIDEPLLTAQPILFVVRQQYLPDHHNTATLFQTGEINAQSFRGGSAIRTIDFAHGWRADHAARLPQGVARDMEVQFRWSEDTCFPCVEMPRTTTTSTR